MSGGRKIIGMWHDQPDTQSGADIDMTFVRASARGDQVIDGEFLGALPADNSTALTEQPASPGAPEGYSETLPPPFNAEISESEPLAIPLWRQLATPLLLILAVAWIGFLAWVQFGAGTGLPPLADLPAFIASAAIPLVLLACLYLILQRSSRAEADRYGFMAHRMEQQSHQMEVKLAGLNAYLGTSREELSRHADEVARFGLDTAERLQFATHQIKQAMTEGLAAGEQLSDSSMRALQQAEGLIAGLPKVDGVATRLTEHLREAARDAYRHGSALEVQIAVLREQSELTGTALSQQQEDLKGRVTGLVDQMQRARAEVEATAQTVTENLSQSGDMAVLSFDNVRQEADRYIGTYLAQLDDAHIKLDGHGQRLLASLVTQLGEADASVAALTTRIETQEAQTRNLTDNLVTALNDIDGEFAAFDAQGRDRIKGLSDAIALLKDHTEAMTSKVNLGAEGANQLIGRSEDLLVALDSVTRELEESLPSAFGRLDERLAASRHSLGQVSPELEKVEAVADATLGRLREADILIGVQHRTLQETDGLTRSVIASHRDTLGDLQGIMADINVEADRLSEQTGPRLVEALVRVRETANQAAEKARQALAAVIPESADKLGEASAQALSAAVGTQLEARLTAINSATERTLTATTAATDQLLQQVSTITDASGHIEKRIAEATASLKDADSDHMTQRVNVLIESLKSIAIDVTKILSTDVSDSSWEAYLKGDRGVFARRAVNLVGSGESRDILRKYDEDMEFREHVNRYIHDFEAMLRNLLGTRNGSSLSVTMLSSDMGKLYVALAQAIERLRT